MVINDPLTELATQHDVALFDAELARLPEKYRAPIVLHHLEGKSHREVATALQLTEGAVDGLLKRGRNELRLRLARRGVVFGVTLVALQSAQNAVAASTTESLVLTTVKSALSLDPTLNPNVPQTTAAQFAQQEITLMSCLHAGKTVGWILVASALVSTTAIGVGAGSGANPKSLGTPVGMISVMPPALLTLPAGLRMQLAAFVTDASVPDENDPSPSSVGDEDLPDVSAGEDLPVMDSDEKEESAGKLEMPQDPAELEKTDEDQPDEYVATETNESMTVEDEAEESSEVAAMSDEQPAHFRRLRASEQRIYKALTAGSEVSFVSTGLIDALDSIEQQHNIDIMINEKQISENGGSADVSINLELKEVELQSVLNLMLEPYDLSYIVKDETLIITSRAAADEFLELRVYSLDGFQDVDDNFSKNWESLVKDAVGGDWNPTEGVGGTVRVFRNSLIVRHNQRIHGEIENLLKQLRQAQEGE
jgi:hypothetical protein